MNRATMHSVTVSVLVFIKLAAALNLSGPPEPSPSNPNGTLSIAQKEAILAQHNEGRSHVQPAASNMNRLVWDETLEVLAQASVDSCRYDLDLDDDSGRRDNLIQLTGIAQDLDFSLSSAAYTWYTLASYYGFETRDCSQQLYCQVYKLVSWASATNIACAQMFCPILIDGFANDVKSDSLYWKCIYENVGQFWQSDVDPYVSGGSPCTDCSSGSGWCRDNLCDSIGCSSDDAECSCIFDNPPCNDNGVLNSTACTCECDGDFSGNECAPEACGFSCGPNAVLNETTCECNCSSLGFELVGDGLSCQDIDECVEETALCDELCINTNGSYDCACQGDNVLQADGYSCAPFDFQFSRITSPPDLGPAELLGTTTISISIPVVTAPPLELNIDIMSRFLIVPQIESASPDGCLSNETDCWESPPVFGDGNDCPQSCYACGCDSSTPCRNGGVVARTEAGICRCFCSFPWTGSVCEDCNLQCENGGTLDASSCQCLCNPGWSGYDCTDQCVETSRLCYGATANYCSDPAVTKFCPVVCGQCVI